MDLILSGKQFHLDPEQPVKRVRDQISGGFPNALDRSKPDGVPTEDVDPGICDRLECEALVALHLQDLIEGVFREAG